MAVARLLFPPADLLAQEVELVAEFRIDLGIGNIAAGRDIDVVDLDALTANVDRCMDVPAVGLASPFARLHVV